MLIASRYPFAPGSQGGRVIGLIVDLFAGGGGASTGIDAALGWPVVPDEVAA